MQQREAVLLAEKKEAATIAAAFQPHKPPEWPGYELSAHHKTFDAASGDWYTFEESQSGEYLHLIMCDIAGHGVQAGVSAGARYRALLHN